MPAMKDHGKSAIIDQNWYNSTVTRVAMNYRKTDAEIGIVRAAAHQVCGDKLFSY